MADTPAITKLALAVLNPSSSGKPAELAPSTSGLNPSIVNWETPPPLKAPKLTVWLGPKVPKRVPLTKTWNGDEKPVGKPRMAVNSAPEVMVYVYPDRSGGSNHWPLATFAKKKAAVRSGRGGEGFPCHDPAGIDATKTPWLLSVKVA